MMPEFDIFAISISETPDGFSFSGAEMPYAETPDAAGFYFVDIREPAFGFTPSALYTGIFSLIDYRRRAPDFTPLHIISLRHAA